MNRQSLVSSSVENANSMNMFFNQWMIQQEEILNELESCTGSADSESRLSELLDRVMRHYTEYYNAKSRVAVENVFLLFSPTWLTPLERSFLWIGGLKPGLAFHIVDRFVAPLSDEQSGKIEELKELTRAQVKELDDEFARIQETVAAPPVLGMAKRAARAVDGELVDLETGLGSLRREFETLVECADFLRFRTVMRMLSVLEIGQSVRFFTGLARFQVTIRRLGIQQESTMSS